VLVGSEIVSLTPEGRGKSMITNNMRLRSQATQADLNAVLAEAARVPDISPVVVALRFDWSVSPPGAEVLCEDSYAVVLTRKADRKWKVVNVARVVH